MHDCILCILRVKRLTEPAIVDRTTPSQQAPFSKTTCLPVQVVEVGAAYSAASERMLQHMRSASLIGADVEPAIGPDGERRCAVISFMVPAAASRRKGEGRRNITLAFSLSWCLGQQ